MNELGNLEINQESLWREVWKSERTAVDKKREYLLNLSQFRKASDNARNLTLLVDSKKTLSSEDIANIQLAIQQENDYIECLRLSGSALYIEYDNLSSIADALRVEYEKKTSCKY